jgi:hypothetical protein
VQITDIDLHLLPDTRTHLETQPSGHVLFFWAYTTTLFVETPHFVDTTDISWGLYMGVEGRRSFVKPSVRLCKDGRPIGSVDLMDQVHWAHELDKTGVQHFVAIARRQQLEGFEEHYSVVIVALQVERQGGF